MEKIICRPGGTRRLGYGISIIRPGRYKVLGWCTGCVSTPSLDVKDAISVAHQMGLGHCMSLARSECWSV